MPQQTPFVFTIQVDDVCFQIDHQSFGTGEPIVTVYLDPKSSRGTEKGKISLSSLKAGVEDVTRFWKAYKSPYEPEKTIATTTEEKKEEPTDIENN